MDLLLDFGKLNFDLVVDSDDLKTDEGLRTSVIVSLFTDRRVTPEEVPAEETSRRGWWADQFSEIEGDQIGSKLWLLRREKQTEQTRKRAQEYAEEALSWMLEDNLAQSVTVEAEWISPGFLGLGISIQRPEGKVSFKFKVNWLAEMAR